MIIRIIFSFLLVVWVPALCAKDLKMKNIPEVMERLFELHVEKNELNSKLMQRIYNLYIDQFDPQKIYLTENEVLEFISFSDKEGRKKMQRCKKGDYSDFIQMNQVFKNAIIRFQKVRRAIGENERGSSVYAYTTFAESEQDLEHRQRNIIINFYAQKEGLTHLEKERLLERKLVRHEESYLNENKKEAHYFTLHFLKAFAKSLDAHTCFFSPEEAFDMRMNLEKQYQGLGIVLQDTSKGVMIADILRNSPAEKSQKIQKKDLLIAIDNQNIESFTFDEVLSALKKKNREKILLGLKRDDHNFSVKLRWASIDMEEDRLTYSYEKVEGGIMGKITLPSFYENGKGISSEKDIINALEEMEKIAPLQGLIIDLRENSGGFLTQAVKVAGLFLSNGVVVIAKYSDGEKRYLRTMNKQARYSGPLILLTSRLSASASEIVVGTLQDYGVALIVGDKRTFGKGTIQYQTVTDDHPDFFFKVTVGKYYTVSGNTPQMQGIPADIVVPTRYQFYQIGEKFLQYPLPFDQVAPAYYDTLEDLAPIRRLWYDDNYLPHLQRYNSFWKKHKDYLRENSRMRLKNNPAFQDFLHNQSSSEDLQLEEASNILKDMIELYSQKWEEAS